MSLSSWTKQLALTSVLAVVFGAVGLLVAEEVRYLYHAPIGQLASVEAGSRPASQPTVEPSPSKQVLPIAAFRQTRKQSCEAAALKMALAYRSIQTDEAELTKRFGYNPSTRNLATNVWGDPDQAFVGSIDGKQDYTGYGVYAGPVAKAAVSFGRNAEALHGVSPQQIAAELADGNPVIAWGWNKKSVADSWKTPSGKTIKAWKGEHARLVYGFTGSIDHPTGFYLNEPASGTQLYWTTDQLSANLNVFGNLSNQVVVVR